MEHVDKLGTVDGVRGREPTSREYAQLEELGDGAILCHSCGRKREGKAPLSHVEIGYLTG